MQGQGVAQTFLEGLIEGFDYLDFRSDTHAKNKAMQHIFEKLGFKQVGKVPVDGERLAYQKLKSMPKKYAKMLYKSPIGPLSLVADDHYLFGIWIEEESDFEKGLSENDVTLVESHPIINRITSYLETYFKGQDQDLSEMPLAPVGSDFEKRVWNYLRGIPFGQTVTYGQIAKDLQVASAQAIGGAVGRNPWSILVPCHRVLGAGGRLTGYAWGLEKKAWLLNHEGASYQENKK